MRILIIEDDPGIAQTLDDLLSPIYQIDLVDNGTDGLAKARVTEYDMILLDLGLPDMSGKEVCRKLREDGVVSPILILTARDAITDKVTALDSGADDYVLKPFSLNELTARMRAIMRRSPVGMTSNQLIWKDINLDTVTRTVTRQGKRIPLRRKEFDLLEYLLRHQGRVLTRAMIIDHLWDDNGNPFSNIVDVHIKYLRDRLEKPFDSPVIKTVHGLGYTIPTASK